jgi:hypothetical protein
MAHAFSSAKIASGAKVTLLERLSQSDEQRWIALCLSDGHSRAKRIMF